MKILSFVDPEDQCGFGFEGVLFRSGSVVTPRELRPGDHFPEIPIALEYLRGAPTGPPGRRRRPQVYILWRYDAEADAWSELGRAVSESWEWALDLRPIAIRALAAARSRVEIERLADLPAIARRIAHYLDTELKPLDPPNRARVVAVLHDQLAARAVR